jgi:hypothetical protein
MAIIPRIADPGQEEAERRYRVLYVSPELLLEFVVQMSDPARRPRYRVSGLPEGARFVCAGYLQHMQMFGFLVEHPSFEPVPAFYAFPQLDGVLFHPVHETDPCPTCGHRVAQGREWL